MIGRACTPSGLSRNSMCGICGNSILQSAPKDLLPPETLSRLKQGFAVPVGEWLREFID
ncbi:MAG: asparagine synthase-related protein [Planctomycetota bacterium]